MSFVLKYAKEEQIIKDRFWGGVEEVTMVLQILSKPKSTQENIQTFFFFLKLLPETDSTLFSAWIKSAFWSFF